MALLGFSSILGFAIFLSYYFPSLKKGAVFFTICSIIVLLFFSGALGILGSSSKIIFICGLLLFITMLSKISWELLTRKSMPEQEYFLPLSAGTILFAIFGLIWFILSRHAALFGWDEFFWAGFTKALKYSNAFYGPNDAILQSHVQYPPGSSLFQYFFITLASFKESILYFANGLIIIAGITALIDLTKTKAFEIFLVTLFSSIITIIFYSPTYITIANDPIIGMLFAVGLCLVILYRGKLNSLWIMLLPIVSSLPLVKDTGLVLAVIISGMFLLKSLFEYNFFENRTAKQLIKFLMRPIIIIGLPFAVREMWNLHLMRSGTTIPYSFFNLHNVLTVLFNPTPGKEQIITSHFYRAFFKNAVGGYVALFLGIFLVVSYLETRGNSRKRLERFMLALSIIGGLVLYLFVILMAYIFFFSTYEGIALASYERYIASYLLGLGLLAFVTIVCLEAKKLVKIFCGIAGIVLIFSLWHSNKTLISMYADTVIHPEKSVDVAVRKEISADATFVNKYLSPKDNIWFIYQDSYGLQQMIFRYEVAPHHTNDWWWAMGKPINAKDVWTDNLPHQNFTRILNNGEYNDRRFKPYYYNYIFLGRADDNFWQHYGNMFVGNLNKDKSYRLFKIIRDKKGAVHFQPVITAERDDTQLTK